MHTQCFVFVAISVRLNQIRVPEEKLYSGKMRYRTTKAQLEIAVLRRNPHLRGAELARGRKPAENYTTSTFLGPKMKQPPKGQDKDRRKNLAGSLICY